MDIKLDSIEFKYLKSLANQFPNIASASTEIINLRAILNLPKGTEHFISDIHGVPSTLSAANIPAAVPSGSTAKK